MNLEAKKQTHGCDPHLHLEPGGHVFQPIETIIGVSDFQEHRYGFKYIDLFFYGITLKEILFFF